MRVLSGAGAAVPSTRHVGAKTRASPDRGSALLARVPTGAGYLLGPPGAGSPPKKTVLELDHRLPQNSRTDCSIEFNFGERGLRAASGRITGAHLDRRAERARMRVTGFAGGVRGVTSVLWGSRECAAVWSGYSWIVHGWRGSFPQMTHLNLRIST